MADEKAATSTTVTADTPTPVSRHTLLNIPTEVLERIAQVAEPQDLLNFRLVCRELDEKISRTYIKRHFTERAFLLCSEDSLRTLLNIASEEKYGRCMRKVILCIDDISDEEDDDEYWSSKHDTLMHDGVHSEEQILAKIERDSQYRAQMTRQKALRVKDVDLHLLTMVFARFRFYNCVPEVQVRDRQSVEITPTMMRTIHTMTGRLPDTPAVENIRYFKVVVEALALSDLRVERATFDAGNWAVDVDEFTCDLELARHTKAVFCHLTQLELQFNVLSEIDLDDLAPIVKIFNCAENVTNLILRSHIRSTVEWFTIGHRILEQWIAGLGDFPRVKHLCLDRFVLTLEAFAEFIRRHKSLQQVMLFKCAFYAVHSVADIECCSTDNGETILKRLTGLDNVSVKDCQEFDGPLHVEVEAVI